MHVECAPQSGWQRGLGDESGAQIRHNEWFRVKLEIDGSLVKVYVNGVLELTVPDMRLGASRHGGIGLFVDVGTEGYFSNLRVTPQ